MKIDYALKEFTEKYDRVALESIEDIATDFGLLHNNITIGAFDIQKAFESYTSYLVGYGQFKENLVTEKTEADEKIDIPKSFKKFIETQIISEKKLTYDELPKFVTSYIEGVKALLEKVDEVKEHMLEAGVDNDSVGDVNTYTDMFMEKLQSAFYPTMERFLRASGYTTNKNLFGNTPKKQNVFV